MQPRVPFLTRRLVIAAGLLLLVIVVGTLGFTALEGWPLFDALYFTVMNVTTVGSAQQTDVAGKWWTILVVAVGFGVLTYTVLALVGYVIEGHLGDAFESRWMRRRVARLTGHYIICGFGRVGREIADEFTAEGIAFVVVDSDADSLRRAAAAGFRVVQGDAADVETLKAAGAERARGLVTAVDSDADNIYVTLSARVLKPDLFIVARANRPDAEPKLRLAGANRVVSPYTMGGRRLASLAMRPTAVEFVDTILSATNGELLLEDFTIQAGSRWVGRPLGALVAEADEAIVLALKRAGRLIFRPAADTVLVAGDELVAAGPPPSIKALEGRL